MSDLSWLRLRMIATYAGVLLAALCAFAAAAVITIDQTSRRAMDERLNTAAYGIDALVEVQDGRITIEEDARSEIMNILNLQINGVVLGVGTTPIVANVASTPTAIAALQARSPQYFFIGSGDRQVRAFVLPIMRGGRLIGKIVTWAPDEWIEQTDRWATAAFAAAAIVIAILAVPIGAVLTRRALDDAFARQRRFTADASHELRAPLAVIRAEADLALRSEHRDDSAYRSALSTIAEEADRIETLIGDLLSIARAESRADRRENVDVGAVARNACDRVSSTARTRAISISIDAAEDALVVANPSNLERALLAILHNAVKYAPERGIITVRVTRRARKVYVSVRDNGPGFSTEALEHALERFWRGDSANAGGGLGLPIARSIVEAYNGRLSLTNTATGAEVRIAFPAT